MKKYLIGLFGVLFAGAVYATCTTNTVFSGGKVIMCTTCCYGGSCTTTCL